MLHNHVWDVGSSQACQEVLRVQRNQKANYHHISSLLDPILSPINPVHTISIPVKSVLILSSDLTPNSYKYCFSVKFSHQNTGVYTFILNLMRATYPAHHILLT
jgi:hypothetical protein